MKYVYIECIAILTIMSAMTALFSYEIGVFSALLAAVILHEPAMTALQEQEDEEDEKSLARVFGAFEYN